MKKNNKIVSILVLIIAVISYVFSDSLSDSYAKEEKVNQKLEQADIKVHYIDVGQADSIFIELTSNRTMLIDAAESDNSDKIIDYIKNLGYNTIDYLVATHPHADHIGGMKDVVEEFDIVEVYMPKAVTTTKTYENLLKAIDSKNLKIKTAKAGVNIIEDSDLIIDIIAPNKDKYDDLNNYSACIKLTYKDVSYLFMGDAEVTSEKEINSNIDVDVLKVGHHGSDTSSGNSFLNKVSPSYAIISVGSDNSYGHPHKEVLNRLEDVGATIYRTDLNGSIIVSTDGKDIGITTEK